MIKKKDNSILILRIIVFFIFIFFMIRIYIFLFKKIEFKNVIFENISCFCDGEVLALRDEELIFSDSRLVHLTVLNDFVVPNDTFGMIFNDEVEFKKYLKSNKKNFNISKKIFLDLSSFNNIKNIINNEIIKFKSKFDILNSKEKIFTFINNHSKFKESNYSKFLDIINETEIENENKKIDNVYENNNEILKIKKNIGGFFVDFYDGYENILDFEAYNNSNYNDSDDLFNNFKKKIQFHKNVLGKFIKSNYCIFICKISEENLKLIDKTNDICIFTNLSNQKIMCKILKIGNNIMVLKVPLTEETLNLRYEKIKIKLFDFLAFKIEKTKIIYKDVKPGIFIKDNNKLIFKYVQILYAENDYYICKNLVDIDNEKDLIKNNDEIY